jgi:hypothetical protein
MILYQINIWDGSWNGGSPVVIMGFNTSWSGWPTRWRPFFGVFVPCSTRTAWPQNKNTTPSGFPLIPSISGISDLPWCLVDVPAWAHFITFYNHHHGFSAFAKCDLQHPTRAAPTKNSWPTNLSGAAHLRQAAGSSTCGRHQFEEEWTWHGEPMQPGKGETTLGKMAFFMVNLGYPKQNSCWAGWD